MRIAVAAAILLFSVAAQAQSTIKIGLVTALSGQSARAGEAITRGLEVAIDELIA
jgi:branched-chain amino acid transport system substrate-binding protein